MSEEIITPAHWLVITNPRAGKRKFGEQCQFVRSELDKARIPYHFKITEYSGHAIEIAKYYTKRGCLNFLVLGGDGTISEVINGIFLANPDDTSAIKIALFPRGTGNDWGRFWQLKKNDKNSMQVFMNGKSRRIDVGKMEYQTADNQPACHYFINSVGFGLDAAVTDLTHRLRKYVGSFSLLYTLALLLVVFRYKPVRATLTMNDQTHTLRLFTMNIANGPYSGGGIKQNPTALPYDGIFDMMMVEKTTLKDIATALPLLFNGKLSDHTAISTFQTDAVEIRFEENTPVEADGIVVPTGQNCRVSILPKSIQMVVPE